MRSGRRGGGGALYSEFIALQHACRCTHGGRLRETRWKHQMEPLQASISKIPRKGSPELKSWLPSLSCMLLSSDGHFCTCTLVAPQPPGVGKRDLFSISRVLILVRGTIPEQMNGIVLGVKVGRRAKSWHGDREMAYFACGNLGLLSWHCGDH